LARVNNLTQSILAKAFWGELTELWRNDNPELISGENSAEALLESVRAERAATLAKRVETCSGNDHRGGEYFHFDNSNVSLENDDDPLRSAAIFWAAIPRGYWTPLTLWM
jgi:hypothetical protein